MNFNELSNIIEDFEIQDEKICIKSNLYNVIEFLKTQFSYNVLKSITAVDLGDDEIELLYHLFSIIDEEDVIISIIVKSQAESIVDLFESAKADENEIYDMFGVIFLNNDDLKRLYMPENWEGFPLRKDYIQDDTRLAWNDYDSYNA